MKAPRKQADLLLKGTRTAMSFVAEARRLAISDPYPQTGQPGYSTMADVLARCVLFANWEVVGAAALVRAGSVTRVVEMGLLDPYRTDEFMRRLTWRMLADASHDLVETSVIEDAYRQPMDISEFVARRRATRRFDQQTMPTPIGRLQIPLPGGRGRSAGLPQRELEGIPRAPRGFAI
ncbi:MAG: hypothetical protein KDK10_07925 [Maritimibacter sp.]|nr:hypothetical protein [Maritimibacter sp.]